MNAASKPGRKRAGARRRAGRKAGPKAGPKAGSAQGGKGQAGRLPARAVFSVALSLLAVPMALAGLLIPLPAGLAAVLMASIALVAGRGRNRTRRIAFAALVLAVCGLAGGFAIGLAVTAAA